jgi:hypothetical protein
MRCFAFGKHNYCYRLRKKKRGSVENCHFFVILILLIKAVETDPFRVSKVEKSR